MENVETFLALIRAVLWEDVKVNGYRLKVNDLPVSIGFDISKGKD